MVQKWTNNAISLWNDVETEFPKLFVPTGTPEIAVETHLKRTQSPTELFWKYIHGVMDLFTGANPTMDNEGKGWFVLRGIKSSTTATQINYLKRKHQKTKALPGQIGRLTTQTYRLAWHETKSRACTLSHGLTMLCWIPHASDIKTEFSCLLFCVPLRRIFSISLSLVCIFSVIWVGAEGMTYCRPHILKMVHFKLVFHIIVLMGDVPDGGDALDVTAEKSKKKHRLNFVSAIWSWCFDRVSGIQSIRSERHQGQ